jgi:signal-transduction protein with cAMP-binding, CBS, and nucleotidyltransferase domain
LSSLITHYFFMLCPSCGFDNIEGEDRCVNCLAPLRNLDVPRAEATAGLVRSAMEDTLGEIEKESVLVARADETVAGVVRRMSEENCNCVLVVKDGELNGIFTERDAWQKLSSERQANETSIGDVMTPKPETLRESDTIAAALSRMSIGRYRYVPVRVARQDNIEYKVISIKHILKYIAHADW